MQEATRSNICFFSVSSVSSVVIKFLPEYEKKLDVTVGPLAECNR